MLRIIKSHEAAEEICIDIFTKLWIGKDLIRDIKNMDGFLYTVAHNKAMDFLRLSSKNNSLQKAIAYIITETGNTSADANLLAGEMEQILKEAVEQLSPQRKIMFAMSRQEGLSHEEIAQRLGLTIRTVKNTITDSLNRIRDYLRKKDVDSILILWFIMNS